MIERSEPMSERSALAVRLESLRRVWFELGVAGCTAAVLAFLLVQLTAWPPHEDEALALFVGRASLGGLFETVHSERGGAPLHFLLSWVVAHAGGGLVELRLISALFGAASIPVIAALGARLTGRGPGLAAAVLASGSWVLLFHGVYGRMYSLFLFASALSYVALLAALERGGRRAWSLWALTILLVVASHPYGALVLASQAAYSVVAGQRRREAAVALAAVAVLGLPFWITDVVLAGRFEVGVGGGGKKLGSPGAVLDYLWRVAADYSAGYRAALIPILLLALAGLVRLTLRRPRTALLAVVVIGTPAAALTLARLGSSTAPESRHLIFALPFFALLVADGLVAAARRLPRAPLVAALALAALVPAEVGWGWQKTPPLYEGEAQARGEARAAASAWLAATSRPDDVLLGYEPLYLQAWERAGDRVSRLVVPRADSKLAFKELREFPNPLGRGVWVFDASDTNNFVRRLEIPLRYPDPREAFEARVYGPFLVIRTREPTRSIRNYLKLARRAQLVGKELFIGDADINLVTVLQTSGRLARYDRASRDSRSTVSR